MKLTLSQYRELVRLALNKSLRGWIETVRLERARRGRWSGYRACAIADLEKAGLVVISPRNSREVFIDLTDAGKETIRTMPDDIDADWFPLPRDIAKAKGWRHE